MSHTIQSPYKFCYFYMHMKPLVLIIDVLILSSGTIAPTPRYGTARFLGAIQRLRRPQCFLSLSLATFPSRILLQAQAYILQQPVPLLPANSYPTSTAANNILQSSLMPIIYSLSQHNIVHLSYPSLTMITYSPSQPDVVPPLTITADIVPPRPIPNDAQFHFPSSCNRPVHIHPQTIFGCLSHSYNPHPNPTWSSTMQHSISRRNQQPLELHCATFCCHMHE